MGKLSLFCCHGSGDSFFWSSYSCGWCSLTHTQKDELLLFTLPTHIPLTITISLCPVHVNLPLCPPPPTFQPISCNCSCLLRGSSDSWKGIADSGINYGMGTCPQVMLMPCEFLMQNLILWVRKILPAGRWELSLCIILEVSQLGSSLTWYWYGGKWLV